VVDRQRRARATIEMELDTDAPAGVLLGPDGSEHAFSGWLEFVSAIEVWQADALNAQVEGRGHHSSRGGWSFDSEQERES
jgi:hypothetical protein